VGFSETRLLRQILPYRAYVDPEFLRVNKVAKIGINPARRELWSTNKARIKKSSGFWLPTAPAFNTQLLADALKRDPNLEVVGAHSTDLIATATLTMWTSPLSPHIWSRILFAALKCYENLRSASEDQNNRALDSSRREIILEALPSGSKRGLSRHESLETLCQCVRQVHAGQIWQQPADVIAVEALAAAPTVRAVDAKGLSLLPNENWKVVPRLAEGLTIAKSPNGWIKSAHHKKLFGFEFSIVGGVEPDGASLPYLSRLLIKCRRWQAEQSWERARGIMQEAQAWLA